MTGVTAYADLLRKQLKALAAWLRTPRRAHCRATGPVRATDVERRRSGILRIPDLLTLPRLDSNQ